MKIHHYQFDCMTIIGLGLIGSSIARAARKHHIAQSITVCDTNQISLGYAMQRKFADFTTDDPAFAVKEADLVIFATPVNTYEAIAKAIAPHLRPHTLIMDVGSVKQKAMEAIAPHLPKNVIYVPAHPIAGSEKTGVSAGRADLFNKKRVIITPEAPLGPKEMKLASKFWEALGSRVEAMPPAIHDHVYGYVSHLPQLLAFAAAHVVQATEKEIADHPVLQQFLRLAGSDKMMWAELFILNSESISQGLDRYLDAITHVQKELKNAPAEEKSGRDKKLTRLMLFPRIASSCLVTTIMEAEKNAGFSLARYAGTGFADFTATATIPPEQDMEHISAHFSEVAALLEDYSKALKAIRDGIAKGDAAKLSKLL
jgi:cyclohexadieny/prephenate dehydrogenase